MSARPSNRFTTITQKIPTQFGSLYTHVSHDEHGQVCEVSFSSPGKFNSTAVGDALIALAHATNSIIADIGLGQART